MEAKAPLSSPSFQLDLQTEQLWRGSQLVPLRPTTFAVLRYLVERPTRVVTKDELLEAVWPDTYITEAQIKGRITELRKALQDDARTPQYIETVHGRGYRFIGHLPTTSQAVVSRQCPVVSRTTSGGKEQQEQASGQQLATHLVGRETELTQLRSWLEKVLHGER